MNMVKLIIKSNVFIFKGKSVSDSAERNKFQFEAIKLSLYIC